MNIIMYLIKHVLMGVNRFIRENVFNRRVFIRLVFKLI